MKNTIRIIGIILVLFTLASSFTIFFGDHSSKKNGNTTATNEHITKPYSDVTYVAFGDSITYGIDGVNGGRMTYPYPTLVGTALDFKSVDNRAVSGATLASGTDGRTNMTKNILAFKGTADIISVMLGVNDFSANRPLGTMSSRDNSTIYGSLHMIAKYLTEKYPDAFIFFMTPFDCKSGGNTNSAGYKLEDVANAVTEVANAYGIPVLDMYKNGEFEVEFSVKGDGLHPSQEHFIKYTAPQIVNFIKKNY